MNNKARTHDLRKFKFYKNPAKSYVNMFDYGFIYHIFNWFYYFDNYQNKKYNNKILIFWKYNCRRITESKVEKIKTVIFT